MISIATSSAALAWTPALAALPLIGSTAPILTVVPCAQAGPARATAIEAAQSNPAKCLNFIFLSETDPPQCQAFGQLLQPGCARPCRPRCSPSFGYSALHGRLAGASWGTGSNARES